MNGGNLMMMDESDMLRPQVRITSRLIDSLYTEAMLLADEARSYFDEAGRDERSTLEPFARVPLPFAVNASAVPAPAPMG